MTLTKSFGKRDLYGMGKKIYMEFALEWNLLRTILVAIESKTKYSLACNNWTMCKPVITSNMIDIPIYI